MYLPLLKQKRTRDLIATCFSHDVPFLVFATARLIGMSNDYPLQRHN